MRGSIYVGMSKQLFKTLIIISLLGYFSQCSQISRCLIPMKKHLKCDNLEDENQCLGIRLRYKSVITGKLSVLDKTLKDWRSFSGYPDCWKFLAPLLCSMYMPKCENSTYELPSKLICRKARRKCAIIFDSFPNILKCDHTPFVSNCSNNHHRLRVTNESCTYPLQYTADEHSYYAGMTGCGLRCMNPAYTRTQHSNMHLIIGVMCALAVMTSGFAVATAVLSWRRAGRYPQAILFYANTCLLVATLGWSVQFLPGARRDIVCRRDRTLRLLEPRIGDGESATCALVFVIIYYCSLAAVSWFAVLAYAWRLSFASLRTDPTMTRRILNIYVGYFHMFAWSLPLVLTIACLASTAVEGDSLTGICYVSEEWRLLYVILPVSILVISALAMIISGLVTLLRLRNSSARLMSPIARSKVSETIVRVSVFAILVFISYFMWISAHFHRNSNISGWNAELRKYIVCRLTESYFNGRRCELHRKPKALIATMLSAGSFFTTTLLMSSFAWNNDTFTVWKRFLKRRLAACNSEQIDKQKMLKSIEKHRIIAEAFKKRTAMHLDGEISLSFATGCDIEDPIGLRMVGNHKDAYISGHSSAGIDISDSWMAAIPRLVQRRGAICMQRRYSDSDFESVRSSLRRWSSAASDSLFGGLASLSTSQKHISDRSSTSRERVLEKLARVTHSHKQSSSLDSSPSYLKSHRISQSSVEGSSCGTTIGGTDTAWSVTSGDEQNAIPLLRSSSKRRNRRRLVSSSHRWLTESRRNSNSNNEDDKKLNRSKRRKRRKRPTRSEYNNKEPSEELANQSLLKHARVSDWLKNGGNKQTIASCSVMTPNSSFKDISSLSSSDVRSIDIIDLNDIVPTVMKRNTDAIKYNNFLHKDSLALKVKSKIKSSLNSTRSFITDSHDKVKHIYIDPNDS